jgi:4-hydroxyphenylacetate 3-monooxygenase
MLKTGRDHLESLRDGRVVLLGGERVADVTAHPAFAAAARSIAGLYDLPHRPELRETLSFDEGGERFAMHFLQPRSMADLLRRMRGHKAIAAATYGLMGRSPDHVASFVTGMAMQAEVLGARAKAITGYYRAARAADWYIAYAVIPPAGARDAAFFGGKPQDNSQTIQVVDEDDAGVTISGMKLLATGAVFANELWLGNIMPIPADRRRESITCAIPIATPGLTLWSRKPYALQARSAFESPLSSRFDESDCVVVCDRVKVPWERVFCHDDAPLSRDIYLRTPSHCFGNHQANVRFWAKLELLVGLACRIAQVSGAAAVPAVRETLGRLAGMEAMLGGAIHGQCLDHETLANGFVAFNRRTMYGTLAWCTQNYAEICERVRELLGSGPFQMPADTSFFDDPDLAQVFGEYWSSSTTPALARMKLTYLAWDLLGSEFGARHAQYEKFYAGASFVVHGHSYRECPWSFFDGIVDGLLDGVAAPEINKPARRIRVTG